MKTIGILLATLGFAAYAGRIATPYRAAIEGHFDPSKKTLTQQAPGRAKDLAGKVRGKLGGVGRRRSARAKGAEPPATE